MLIVKGLIWDDWNRKHIAQHDLTTEEVEEVCHGNYEIIESYHKRILVIGKAKSGKLLAIALSPEDRNSKPYEKGIYYPITAYEKGVKK